MFITSVAECLVVNYVAWITIMIALIPDDAVPVILSEFLPLSAAQLVWSFVMAIPISIAPVFGLILVYSDVSPTFEAKYPVVWIAPGRPRFVGAAFCLVIEILFAVAVWLLSFLLAD